MITAIILKYKTDTDKLRKYLLEIGCDDVIVVDNSKHNSGTARGFTLGMQHVKDGFIWLLDEDNMPERDALKHLKMEFFFTFEDFYALACNRTGYKNIVDINSVIGSPNACLGLNIFKYKETRRNLARTAHGLRDLPVAMYGGLFFHRRLLDRIGYPDPDYFMYCDDFEWTYRITKLGGKIILVDKARIAEPDHPRDCLLASRNHLRFQKQFVTNKFVFKINYYLYLLYLLLTRNFPKFKTLKSVKL
jgi:GT2 family glycosyltransferase